MPLRRRQWDNLANALENESCVLLLGPSLSTFPGTQNPLTRQFAQQLTRELEEEGVAYDKAASGDLTYIMQRFSTIEWVMPPDPGFEAKAFYEKYAKETNSIQRSLAALPIPLIVNTAPDALITQALREAGKYQTQFEYYNFRKHREVAIRPPSVEAPLVYNLFGYYADAKSLVLAEEDQVVFTANIVREDPPLPNSFLAFFDPFKTYLFLGFDWEQWPLRLLLRSLKLEKEARILSPASIHHQLYPRTRDFYESQFHLSFINQDLRHFVKMLQQKLGERQPQENHKARKSLYLVSAEADASYREQLYQALRQLPFSIRHRGLTEAGSDVGMQLQQDMDEAAAILLLASPALLADGSALEMDIPIALSRHEAEGVPLIPIIIRPCQWEQLAVLTRMPLILPRKDEQVGFPLSSWDKPDEALQQIVAEIKKLLLP